MQPEQSLTRVSHFGDESAIVVDRYDRLEIGDRVTRVHQEDLCQATGVAPGRKYQSEGGPSPVQIVDLLRTSMSARTAADAVWRFIDALAWNWLIAGTDAHAKNYSLLLANNQVRLAPLYDIASALPYGPHERNLRLAMKIGGHYDVFLQRNSWPRAAKELGVGADVLVDRVRKLALVAADAFSDAASAPAVIELERDLAPRLVDLVADRAARCAALLALGTHAAATT